MAKAQGVRAGRAFVEVYADGSRLDATMRTAGATVERFGQQVGQVGRQMAMLGGAMIAPLAASVRAFVSMGTELVDLSRRTGIAVEALSRMDYAAKQTGTSLNAVETAIRRMQVSITGIGTESAQARDALARLGISAARLQALKPEEQFRQVADAVGRLPDPTERAAVAVALFGRSGTELLPLIDQFGELSDEADRLGITMSQESAEAAKALGDAMTALWAAVRAASNEIGAALAPAIQRAVVYFTDVAARAVAWVRANHDLIVQFGRFAVAITGAGIALAAFAKALTVVKVLTAALAGPVGLAYLSVTLVALAVSLAVVDSALARVNAQLGYIPRGGYEALNRELRDTRAEADRVWKKMEAVNDLIEMRAGNRGRVALLRKQLDALRAEMDPLTQKIYALNDALAGMEKPSARAEADPAIKTDDQLRLEKQANDEVRRLHIAYIQDAERREIASINMRYEEMISIAKRAGADLYAIEYAQSLAVSNTRRKFAEQRAAEAKDIADRDAEEKEREDKQHLTNMAAFEEDIAERTARARIMATKEGLDREMALLRLEREQALAEATTLGVDPAAIKRLFALRAELARQQFETPDLPDLRQAVTGTFTAAAIFGLGAASPFERTAKATEETARAVKELNNRATDGLSFG